MCSCSHHTDHTLGLVPKGKRVIRSGYEYDHLFNLDVVDGENSFIKKGDTFETLRQMEKIVKSTLFHTTNIAQKLKGKSLRQTANNIWKFVYYHVQYTLDEKGIEQLRTPIRTWRDRRRGVDCDCYSIFISSILTNLGIPHAFRMTKYKAGWQHVYVVVPVNGNRSDLSHKAGYLTIDAVVDQFDYEVPFTKKFDRFMKKMPIEVLSGLDRTCCGTHVTPGKSRLRRKPMSRRATPRERQLLRAVEESKDIPFSFPRQKFGEPVRFTEPLPALPIEQSSKARQKLQPKPAIKLVPVQSPQIKAAVKKQIADAAPNEVVVADMPEDVVKADLPLGVKIVLGVVAGGTLLMYMFRPQNEAKGKGLQGTGKREDKQTKSKKSTRKIKEVALT